MGGKQTVEASTSQCCSKRCNCKGPCIHHKNRTFPSFSFGRGQLLLAGHSEGKESTLRTTKNATGNPGQKTHSCLVRRSKTERLEGLQLLLSSLQSAPASPLHQSSVILQRHDSITFPHDSPKATTLLELYQDVSRSLCLASQQSNSKEDFILCEDLRSPTRPAPETTNFYFPLQANFKLPRRAVRVGGVKKIVVLVGTKKSRKTRTCLKSNAVVSGHNQELALGTGPVITVQRQGDDVDALSIATNHGTNELQVNRSHSKADLGDQECFTSGILGSQMKKREGVSPQLSQGSSIGEDDEIPDLATSKIFNSIQQPGSSGSEGEDGDALQVLIAKEMMKGIENLAPTTDISSLEDEIGAYFTNEILKKYSMSSNNNWGEGAVEEETSVGNGHAVPSPPSLLNSLGGPWSETPSPVLSEPEKSFIVRLHEFTEMYETASADVECRDVVKTVVGAAVTKGLVTALQEEAARALAAKDAEIANLRDSLQEKDARIVKLETAVQLKVKYLWEAEATEIASLIGESQRRTNKEELDLQIFHGESRERETQLTEYFSEQEELQDEVSPCHKEIPLLESSLDSGLRQTHDLMAVNERYVKDAESRAEIIEAMQPELVHLKQRMAQLSTERALMAEQLHSTMVEMEAKESEVEEQRDAFKMANEQSQASSMWKKNLKQVMGSISAQLKEPQLKECDEEAWCTDVEIEDQRQGQDTVTNILLEGNADNLANCPPPQGFDVVGLESEPDEKAGYFSLVVSTNVTKLGSDLDVQTGQQFLVDFKEKKNIGLLDMLTSNPVLEQKLRDLEAVSTSQQQCLHDQKELLVRRSGLLKKAEDHIACLLTGMSEMNHKVQQQHMDLMSCRSEMGEEVWRGGVEIDLITAYFECTFESLVKQVCRVCTKLADNEGWLASSQKELQNNKLLLQESRGDADSLRAENTVLSSFVDQLTEEIESCQREITNCRNALREASSCSEKSKADFCDLQSQMDDLRGESEGRLNKKGEECQKLEEELELVRWEHKMEKFIFLGVAEGQAGDWSEDLVRLKYEIVLKDAEQKQELQEALESKASALNSSNVLKRQDILKLQAEFRSQEGQLRETLEQERSRLHGMITQVEELQRSKHTLQLCFEEKLQGQCRRQQMEWEILCKILEDKSVEMGRKYTQLCTLSREIEAGAEASSREIEALRDVVHESRLEKDAMITEMSTLRRCLEDSCSDMEAITGDLQLKEKTKAALFRSDNEIEAPCTALHQSDVDCDSLKAQSNSLRQSLDEAKAEIEVATRALHAEEMSAVDLNAKCVDLESGMHALRGGLEEKLRMMEGHVAELEEQIEGGKWRHKVENNIILLVMREASCQAEAQFLNERRAAKEEIVCLHQDIERLRPGEVTEVGSEEKLGVVEVSTQTGLEEDWCSLQHEILHLRQELEGWRAGKESEEEREGRKEVPVQISGSGLIEKERSANADKLLLLEAELEGYKAALKKAEAKGKKLVDQIDGPGPMTVTDPVLVVIRRDNQAAVEGFMVDIGDSPSKNFSSRRSREVVSSLKREVLELRREKEQLLGMHADEVYRLKREFLKESDKIKGETDQIREHEVAGLKRELRDFKQQLDLVIQGMARKGSGASESISGEDAELITVSREDWQKEKEGLLGTISQKDLHLRQLLDELAQASEEQTVLESMKNTVTEHAVERLEYKVSGLERVVRDYERQKEELLGTISQRDLQVGQLAEDVTQASGNTEIMISGLEAEQMSLQSKISRSEEVVDGYDGGMEEMLATTSQRDLDPINLAKELTQASEEKTVSEGLKSVISELEVEREWLKSRVTGLEEVVNVHELEQKQLEAKVTALQIDRHDLEEAVARKVTRLEGERSWLEERVPGLEKRLAAEQSRLEEMVAVHAFERDKLKKMVAAHKIEQIRVENEVTALTNERRQLGVMVATLERARNHMDLTHKKDTERLTADFQRTFKEMEGALSQTHKELEEKATKASYETEVQEMKAESPTLPEKSERWRHLERELAEKIEQVVQASQKVERELCERVHRESSRLNGLQILVTQLHQFFTRLLLNQSENVQSAQNLQKAEEEVDLLGDEVDSLVTLLENLHTVLHRYTPVLQHYPGIAEVVQLVSHELTQRAMLPTLH